MMEIGVMDGAEVSFSQPPMMFPEVPFSNKDDRFAENCNSRLMDRIASRKSAMK